MNETDATQLSNQEGTEASPVQEEDSRETTTSAPSPIPTPEELAAITANIKNSFNFDVTIKPTTFNFKTTKDENKVETKRDSLELPIPYPSIQGIIDILEGSDKSPEGIKQLELLMDAVESKVTQVARSLISDDVTLNATNFPYEKLSWLAISTMPKAERSGGGIAKEIWDDFGTDYIKVMVEATGKTITKVTAASKHLINKFAAIKTQTEVVEFLVSQLAVYTESSPRADEFAGCLEFLLEKADKLINTTPEELLENLM